MRELFASVPPEILGFVLALGLSLLIGFEREELRTDRGGAFFGGVRTFPLIALSAFLLQSAYPQSALPAATGLVVLGILLGVSHWASIEESRLGITSEVAAIVTYAMGAAAARGLYWLTVASGVLAVLLLQEKRRLEGLALDIPREEIATLVRFLVLAGVILPVVPNRPYTRFEINPFTIWLVVVAVSGLSYASYLLQRWIGSRQSALVTGLLGGAYSSTATTVVLARRSMGGALPARAAAGGIVAATGVMYVRIWLLVLLFAPALARHLTLAFWIPAGACLAGGALLARHAVSTNAAGDHPGAPASRNPLELLSAFTFAGVFLAVLVITRLVADQFGGTGVLVLSVVSGAADVDPFILGIAQFARHGLDPHTAALAVLIAAASNNVMKAIYARAFGERRAGLAGGLGIVASALLAAALFFLGGP